MAVRTPNQQRNISLKCIFLRVLSSNDKPKLQVRMKYVALIQVINEPVQCDKKDRWRHTEGKY